MKGETRGQPGRPTLRRVKMALEDLRQSTMMSHLLDALDRGEDIGHYGRLVFAMVARYFMSEEEVVEQLMKDRDCDEQKARGLVKQVEARGYNPPKRERILQWMEQQDFPICESTNDGEACNVYKSLNFPREVYEKISQYYEQDQTAA
jgi:DNA primase large subunit